MAIEPLTNPKRAGNYEVSMRRREGGKTVFFFARSPDAPRTTNATSFFNSTALDTVSAISWD